MIKLLLALQLACIDLYKQGVDVPYCEHHVWDDGPCKKGNEIEGEWKDEKCCICIIEYYLRKAGEINDN